MNNVLKLSFLKRQLYDIIEDSLSAGKHIIKIPNLYTLNDIMDIFKLVVGNNPYWFNIDNCNLNYISNGINNVLQIKVILDLFKYNIEVNRLKEKIDLIYNKYIKNKESEILKVFAIHEYLVNNVQYDFDELNYAESNLMAHNAYGALICGRAVCEGISSAFQILARRAGIKSTVIVGHAETKKHSWNIVEIDGECFHVDVTWDIKQDKDVELKKYDYFCVTDSCFKKRMWNKKWYKKCNSTKFNYFYLSNSIAFNLLDAKKIIEKQLVKYKKIYFKYEGEKIENFTNVIFDFLNEICQKYGYYDYNIKLYYNDDQEIISGIME